jgi:hypothetical protein
MGAPSVIQGNLLDLFDEDSSRGKATVIVEAKRPTVSLPRAVGANVRTSPRELLPAAGKAQASSGSGRGESGAVAADTMRALEAALRELGVSGGARRNELSGSFVVELTREQLERLSRNPAVQAIRADTFRRKLS